MGTDETIRYEETGEGESPLPGVKVSKGLGGDGKERKGLSFPIFVNLEIAA
jgi:hypothetical protein